MSLAGPHESQDLRRALLRSYWVAAIAVANDYGTRIGAPLTKTEMLAVPGEGTPMLESLVQKAASVWKAIRSPADAPVGFLLQPQQTQIRTLYSLLLARAVNPLDWAVDSVDDAHARVECLLVSDPRGHEAVTGIVLKRIEKALDEHFAATHAQPELRDNLRRLLRERWPRYFTALFHAEIQSNQPLRSIVFARLLADLHVRTAGGSRLFIEADWEQGVNRIQSQIEAGFESVHLKLDELLQLLKQTLPLTYRTAGPLPSLSTPIYGREREARAVCDEAADPNGAKVIVLVAPPGFGKTGVLTASLNLARAGADWDPQKASAVIGWDFRDPSQASLTAILLRVGELVDESRRREWEQRIALDLPVAIKLEHALTTLSRSAGTGRIWLLWQNAENLLDGQGRFQNAELGALVRMLWEREHRCCLLFESRLLPELPPTRRRLQPFGATDSLGVGMDAAAALEWLQAERRDSQATGLRKASDADLRALLERVHRIPLALSSVLSYLNGPGSETTLRDFLNNPELFAGYDQADESLRQEAFRPILLHHWQRLAEEDRQLLGFLAQFPFPLRKEAIELGLPDDQARQSALSRQVQSRMIVASDSVVAGGAPVTVYGLVLPIQELLREWAEPGGEAVAFACGNRGDEAWSGKENRLALHLFAVTERILARVVGSGRTELEGSLARARISKGEALCNLGQPAAAITEFESVIQNLESFAGPDSNEHENYVAAAYSSKGRAFGILGQPHAAIAELDAAIKILKRLVEIPFVSSEDGLVVALVHKGCALADCDQPAAAITEFEAAIRILTNLVDSRNSEQERTLAAAHMSKGIALNNLGRAASAVAEADAAIKIFERLVDSAGIELEDELATARMNKGVALDRLGQLGAAIAEYGAAIRIYKRLVESGRTELLPLLAKTHANRSGAVAKSGEFNQSQADIQQAIALADSAIRNGMQGLEKLREAFQEIADSLSHPPLE